jgi:hypothetical protein
MTGNEQKQEGRPPVVTDEVLQKLKEAFLMGCTDQEACLYSGIAPRTLYYYQENNEDFLQQKELWKRNPFLKARLTIFRTLHRPEMARWFMEKRNSKEFSAHASIELEDPHERIRKITQMIDEAVNRITPEREAK